MGDAHVESEKFDAPEHEETEDRTIVVQRDTGELEDHTVVVDRDAEPEDHTVVVERGGEAEDRTVVVERGDGDRTVVVDRNASPDATVVVSRGAKAKRTPTKTPRGRTRINLPPVEPGTVEQAILAPGPGAVAAYAPREIAPQPEASAPIELGPEATRAPAPSMPSVRRSSRRLGVIALVGFALACVVSVAGLAGILTMVLRG